MENISQDEWVKKISDEEDPIIIDVRTPEEWAQGIIKGAKLINIFDMEDFCAEVEKLNKDQDCFLYCRSGARSGHACQIMDDLGFKNTFNLIGGIMNWQGEIIEPND